MIAGLTGGVGAGKSTVAAMLAARGAVVVDTDEIAREIVEPPSVALDRIGLTFGAGMLAPDGRLDRKRLAALVFAERRAREQLEAITHPLILERVRARIGKYGPAEIVVVVVPLLFESGFAAECDATIAVLADEEVRKARVKAREGWTDAEILARMRAQLADREYARLAEITIRNDSDLKALDSQVQDVWERLSALRSG